MSRQRLLDWRFLVTLIVLILVASLCYGFLRRVQQADSLIDSARRTAVVAQRNADETAALRAQLTHQRTLMARTSRKASDERDALAAQLAALLDYLRTHGVIVPVELTGPSTATSTTTTSAPRPRAVAPSSSSRRVTRPKVRPRRASPAHTEPSPSGTTDPLVCVLNLCVP